MKRGFAIGILGFLALLIAQLVSGILLFHFTYGWTPGQLVAALDSVPGLLAWPRFGKTAIVHIATISLLTFVLGHFLSFVRELSQPRKLILSLGLMLSGLINAVSGAAIVAGGRDWVLIKLLSFLTFQIFLGLVTLVILKSALSSLHTGSSTRSKKS